MNAEATAESTTSRTSAGRGPSAPAGWELSPHAREMRLGLVVYGGVSLAIYINGVTHEFYRAVRGRGVYKLFKRLLDTHIVVDIISGTSAGGINGLLLAFALTNDREFGDTALLWREHGSLSKLLRRIEDDGTAASLLDSRGVYIPRLEDALRKMGEIGQVARASEWCSGFPELDLFITGTDFDGRIGTTTDSTGRQIDIKTHRRVFHLKHRRDYAPPLTPFQVSGPANAPGEEARLKALARLAALTSCFPAAFEPVRIGPSSDHAEQAAFDLLKEWGQLEGETWFLDGGVLDNKPFSYTIGEIFNRTAVRPVDRKLFYVEPDPERFDQRQGRMRTSPPTVVRSAIDALVGIPGYESIAEDLERIALRNQRLARQRRVQLSASRIFDSLSADEAANLPACVANVYHQVRLVQLSERAVSALLEVARPHEIGDPKANTDVSHLKHDPRRRAAAELVQGFEAWPLTATMLDRYDVYFRIRRVFHTIYKIEPLVRQLSIPNAATSSLEADTIATRLRTLRSVWAFLNRQLTIYQLVEKALEDQARRLRWCNDKQLLMDKEEVWARLQARFEELLALSSPAALWLDQHTRASVETSGPTAASAAEFQRALSEYGAAIAAADPPPPVEASSNDTILTIIDAQTRAALDASLMGADRQIVRAWDHFNFYDAHFFPIEFFGDLGEKDQIDIVRVSPADAERGFCARRFEDKITGEGVMHFGAFLKRSWRSNDIMWGRLDGQCRLFDALFTKEALAQAVAMPEVRRLLAADLKSGELAAAALFPGAGTGVQSRLTRWLEALTSEEATVRDAAVGDEDGRELLLWCAQLEILAEDLPVVLQDAAVEQLEWNSLLTDASIPNEPPTMTPFNARIDLTSAVIAGSVLTRQFVDGLKADNTPFNHPRDAPLGRYFSAHYTIGQESIRDHIPPAVLLELMTAALLVARNCLLNAFPALAPRVTSSPFYKLLVQYPLTVAHTLAVFARRERPFYLAGLTALVVYAVGALLVGAIWPMTLSTRDNHESVNKIAVATLVVIPLVILVPVLQLAWLRATRSWRRSKGLSLAKTLLSIVTLVCCLVLGATLIAAWSPMIDAVANLAQSTVGIAIGRGIAAGLLIALALTMMLVLPLVSGVVSRSLARRP